ncbi:helix-turn-helix domain-containing protein [Pseudomonas lalucatii]|uniref:Helix-turn-helix domain-containing protein n=1 Tax=Pseudomonas lalucatii TaxID=1424203 RepID=A0ABS5PVH4_9PSED|nr:helix-turn-helix domain-containing protein [Pseudomonas lalucatii]MBS7660533.1 helix-turn-helix domain-containing protein [Pseudomonas lalucatii]
MSGIGDRLREERERLRLSQAAFGEIGGVKANAQGKYESGERFPGADYLASVAERGVDVLYVVTGERKPAAVDCIPADEAQLLEHYRSLPVTVKATLAQLATTLADPHGVS